MTLFASIALATLSAIGIALMILELYRRASARRASFICVCFDERLLDGALPDMLIICKTDAEQEEVIKRVCKNETRRAYIKRF